MSYELTTRTWLSTLRRCAGAYEMAVRGHRTRELIRQTTNWSMDYPIVMLKERKLNFRFMHAEAWWILSGSNLLSDLTPYCKEIAQFSDDKVTMTGAYGVPLKEQWQWCIAKIIEDPQTRQAVISLWRPAPGASLDIPCTLSLQFLIRGGCLHVVASMRSSDAWLGLPYDVFCFSMIGWKMMLEFRSHGITEIEIGELTIHAGSQHVYDRDLERARECLRASVDHDRIRKFRAMSLYGLKDPDHLMVHLRSRRDNPGIEL